MFQILGIFSGIEVSMTSGIYSVVAKVYDMMLDLATRSEALDLASLENLTQTCYVLAGVFMLFRTVIGLIQMLVNPDKMNDSNVGAGKLISRIVISIVLLLVLQPQGILFKSCEGDTCNEGGLAPRIERALLDDEDGLIVRLIELGGGVKITKDNNSQAIDSGIMTKSFSDIGGYLVEDVYAATGDLSCYYFGVSKHERGMRTVLGRPTQEVAESITINKVYKIDFFKSKESANEGVGTPYRIGKTPYYYKVRSGTTIGGVEEYGKYSALEKNVMTAGMFANGFPSECPKYINYNGNSYSPRKDFPYNSITDCGTVAPGSSYVRMDCPNTGILGGYSSYKEFKQELEKLKEDNKVGIKGTGTAKAFVGQGASLFDAADPNNNKGNTEFLSGVSSGAIGFAQASAASFHTCADGATEECKEAQGKMFTSSKGNDELEQLIDDDKLDIGFIISMVVGIALVVYLLILCVDVIVRRLKLTLLQVMAPLPAISYIDPNDKVFGQWGKMYIATYLDLFIKLIAISLALGLLQGLINNDEFSDNLLYRFFYIVAILIFAKLVPSMISKIFGLDSMGGSFKDILGMGKAAAGFGAGAVLGGAVGAATGKGLGRLSGLTKGAMMGAGSGAKGNITGGAQGISARNARINDAKKNGLGFWQRTAAGIAGTVGYSPQTRMDNKIKDKVDKKEMLDNFRKHKDNIEGMADSSNYLSDMKARMERNPNSVFVKDKNGNIISTGKEAYKKYREDFIALNEVNRFNQDTDSVEYYDGTKWIDTGQKAKYYNADGTISDINFEKSTVGKIDQAEKVMQAEFNSKHALQRELGMEGKSINNFKEYGKAEGIARNKSNQYETEIVEVQSSDEYGRAKAFEDYSKKS